jgi:hypothetical protein
MPDRPRVEMPHVYRRGSAIPLIVGPPVPNPDPSLNVDFLNATEYGLIEPMEFSHWGYDLRRKAQSILPFLFVAPMNVCREESFLQENTITMLIGVFPSSGAKLFTHSVAKVAESKGIEHHVLAFDHASFVIHKFSHANFLINSHLARLQQKARVAVYCQSGNETSPVFIAAYLMETFQGMASAEHAMSVVLTRRFCVHYDEDARRMLKAYEDILSARNQVLGTSLGSAQRDRHQAVMQSVNGEGVRLANLKRLRDGMLHNVADDYFEDKERFGGREFVPFRDDGEDIGGQESSQEYQGSLMAE